MNRTGTQSYIVLVSFIVVYMCLWERERERKKWRSYGIYTSSQLAHVFNIYIQWCLFVLQWIHFELVTILRLSCVLLNASSSFFSFIRSVVHVFVYLLKSIHYKREAQRQFLFSTHNFDHIVSFTHSCSLSCSALVLLVVSTLSFILHHCCRFSSSFNSFFSSSCI